MPRKSGVLKKVPIPYELSDLMRDMLKEARIQLRGRKQEKGSYGILLQPWFSEENDAFLEASFAVVDEAGFGALNRFLMLEFGSDGSMPMSTKKGGLIMPDCDDNGVRVRKGLDDYLRPYILIKPPIFCDDDLTGKFTEEYDD